MLGDEEEAGTSRESHKPELADILRDLNGQLGPLTLDQRRAVQAIIDCRTAALGGHVNACDTCNHQHIAYNSCRNRHCPKCGSLESARWIERQESALLPVEYHHVVFTVPDVLNRLFLADPERGYRLLFAAAAETLNEVAANERHLGARIGFISVLHTWTQTLNYHPHIHCIVPGGGLTKDRQWKSCRQGFFLPVLVLSQVFRGKLLHQFERAFADDPAARQLLIEAASKPWVVFSKPPVSGPEQVLKYLGRYVQRTAISNHRILDYDGNAVTFKYRDRSDGNKSKTMTLAAPEFARRVLLHILPKGFSRIRHYGFLANCNREQSLAIARKQLGAPAKDVPSAPESWQDLLLRLTGTDPTQCAHCKVGRLRVIETLLARRPHDLPGRGTSP